MNVKKQSEKALENLILGMDCNAYRQYSQSYVPSERAAQGAHRGIWTGSFLQPAEWRRQQKIAHLLGTATPTPGEAPCLQALELTDLCCRDPACNHLVCHSRGLRAAQMS